MQRILERISSPIRGLHQAAYLLALLTLASQLLALLRDRTFAHLFGASQTLDIYYAAFRIPDLVFALVASLVSAYVLIPLIAGANRERTRELLSHSASFLVIFGGVVCAVFIVYMNPLLAFLYPDLMNSDMREEFIFLAQLLMIQPLLLGLSGVFGSVLQVGRRFVLFALSPVLYNIGIIIGALFLYPNYGLTGIGIGVILGALLYLSINVPVILREGVVPKIVLPRLALLFPIMRESIPRSLALGVGAFTALGLTALASRIGTGSVSVYTFASNLESVPLALIGASYAVAAFPALSESSALSRREEFFNILSASARHIILWSIVAFGLIVVLRAHLVRTILGTGAFDWDATRLTAALLALLAIGLAAQGLVILFTRALYAMRQSWRPLVYQLLAAGLTLGIAYLLITQASAKTLQSLASLLKVGDVSGTSILFIAIAAVVGQLFLALISLMALNSIVPGLTRALVRPCIDGALAALIGGSVSYLVLYLLGGIAPLTTLISVFSQGFVAGLAGLTASAGVLYFIENQEFRTVTGALGKLIYSNGRGTEALPPSAREHVSS